jgi:hypothetical protein
MVKTICICAAVALLASSATAFMPVAPMTSATRTSSLSMSHDENDMGYKARKWGEAHHAKFDEVSSRVPAEIRLQHD